MTAVDYIVVLTGIIAVVVSLLTATNSAKQSAFDNLKKVVDRLDKELEDERKLRRGLEVQVNALREENQELKEEVRRVTADNARLRSENHSLTAKVAVLSAKVNGIGERPSEQPGEVVE